MPSKARARICFTSMRSFLMASSNVRSLHGEDEGHDELSQRIEVRSYEELRGVTVVIRIGTCLSWMRFCALCESSSAWAAPAAGEKEDGDGTVDDGTDCAIGAGEPDPRRAGAGDDVGAPDAG